MALSPCMVQGIFVLVFIINGVVPTDEICDPLPLKPLCPPTSTPATTTEGASDITPEPSTCSFCPDDLNDPVLCGSDGTGCSADKLCFEITDTEISLCQDKKPDDEECKKAREKAIKEIKDMMGFFGRRYWDKIDPKAQDILIRLRLCMEDKEFRELFKEIKDLVLKEGLDYKKIAELLLKCEWAKKNPKLAKQMADILKTL